MSQNAEIEMGNLITNNVPCVGDELCFSYARLMGNECDGVRTLIQQFHKIFFIITSGQNPEKKSLLKHKNNALMLGFALVKIRRGVMGHLIKSNNQRHGQDF